MFMIQPNTSFTLLLSKVAVHAFRFRHRRTANMYQGFAFGITFLNLNS